MFVMIDNDEDRTLMMRRGNGIHALILMHEVQFGHRLQTKNFDDAPQRCIFYRGFGTHDGLG